MPSLAVEPTHAVGRDRQLLVNVAAVNRVVTAHDLDVGLAPAAVLHPPSPEEVHGRRAKRPLVGAAPDLGHQLGGEPRGDTLVTVAENDPIALGTLHTRVL